MPPTTVQATLHQVVECAIHLVEDCHLTTRDRFANRFALGFHGSPPVLFSQ
jgi:hypothetical protein